MAVTKQTYTINGSGGFTTAAVETALRSALVDAGLMTDWYASFTIDPDYYNPTRLCRVMRIQYDVAKTYGTNYYYFIIAPNGVGVALATGTWTGQAPGGTRFFDWHKEPVNCVVGSSEWLTDLFIFTNNTSNVFIDRYTSGSDPRQSWFIFRQPASLGRSRPFTFLHKDSTLHSWLDLNKGCVSGLTRIFPSVAHRAGVVRFTIDENLRRCLSFGSGLRGTEGRVFDWGNTVYHNFQMAIFAYFGVGSANGGGGPTGYGDTLNFPNNLTPHAAAVPLPVGRNYVNSAYLTDYIPVATDVAWNYYTSAKLAQDFGILMQYANNDIGIHDRVVVQSGINEWEVVDFANNAVLTDGASPSFLARVI